MDTEVHSRPRAIVEAELAAVVDELSRSEGDYAYAQRLRGARDTFEWALGRGATAPISARLIETPDRVALSQENSWAYEVITGVRPAPSVGRDRLYAGGVEEALCWLKGADCIPVPTDEIAEALDEGPVLRDPVQVEQLYEATVLTRSAPPSHYSSEDVVVLDGIIDTLDWLRGKRAKCPVTDTAGPATPETVAGADECYDEIDGALSGRERDYGYGASMALAWALGRRLKVPSVY
jgi:hypothetical protein